MTSSEITACLRPDVDHRVHSAATLSRARISNLINDALDVVLPSPTDLGQWSTGPLPADGGEPGDGDHS